MTPPTPGKVSLRIELVVEDPGGRAERIFLGQLPTPLRDARIERKAIGLPLPSPEDTCVFPVSGGYVIEAQGTVPSNVNPVRVWAYCYPNPGLTTTSADPQPPPGAVSVAPVSGTWAFPGASGPRVPGVTQPDATPHALDNHALVIWYEFAGSPPTFVPADVTPFHGLLPGYGSCPGLGNPPPQVPPPNVAVLHATFTGALAGLGTVGLDANVLGWSAFLPSGDVLTFMLIGSEPHLILIGLAALFDVTGTVVSDHPYVWSATGSAGGDFGVTVTE